MGYSNNRKNPPMYGAINYYTDGCGGSYEDKYYVNGSYIDLCGLPIEEYMKNPFCCNGNNSGSDDDGGKSSNEIMVKAFESENVIYYQAFSKFAVTSNITLSVLSTNGVTTELYLYAGSTQTEPQIADTKEFLTVTLNVNEDDYYKYVTVSDLNKKVYTVYFNTVLLSESGKVDDSFQTIDIETDTTCDLVYIIPGTDFNYNDVEDIEDFYQFCRENQYSLSLCLPKNVYDKGKYTISTYGGLDVTVNFVYVKKVNLDGNEYVYLQESAKEDITPYIPLFNEDIVYEYKLTINN
jgi:hypothetical protein